MKLRKVFEKFKKVNKGVAIVELAFFIPIGYVLLHLILDITSLYRCKDKIQAVTGLAVEMTLATIDKHGQISKNNMKDIAASVFNSFDNNIPERFNCKLYISWDFVRKSDDFKSTYLYQKTPTSEIQYQEGSNYSIAGDIDYFSSTNLNIDGQNLIIIISVGIEKNDSNKTWFGISEFSYNIAKASMPSKFFAQSVLFPQHDLQFPDEVMDDFSLELK